jgi:hypothetical protein
VTTVGVDDDTSIERIVVGTAPRRADISKRACAGAAKRHSASSLSMRSTCRACSRVVIARLSCICRSR